MCISLNKPSFTLLWLALEFFPVQSQEPTLGGRPRDSPKTWDVTILPRPTFSPAATLLTRILKVYIKALTGFSHIYRSDCLNNTLLSQGCILEMAPFVRTVGGTYIPRMEMG